jgi:DNA-binding NtrC family response regulator
MYGLVRSMADLLIVDDDMDVAEILTDVLRSEGHLVRIARDGEEGLRALERGNTELVLLDVEMPVLDGPEMALRMFVRDCGLEKIPVVLLSGVLDLAHVAQVVGTPYFLGKPCRLQELLTLVRRALGERAAPQPGEP